MEKKVIVSVSASFEFGEALFEWLKRYAQAADKQFVYWEEFAFSVDSLEECDAILVLNNPSQKITTLCYPETVIAFMMEPGDLRENPWMFKGLDQYTTVYSPIKKSNNTVLSPGFLGWHVMQNWSELSALTIPEKSFPISCIASTLQHFQGHKQRFNFINTLQNEMPIIQFFGKGRTFIPDKMDGLLPYKYSIAIENTSTSDYFTEKITDCFLSYTIPIYFGCKNIGQFFPEKSFIWIDISDPNKAIEKINWVLENDNWNERIPALIEARKLVLNQYQPLAAASNILRKTKGSVKQNIVLKPVPDHFLKRLKKVFK